MFKRTIVASISILVLAIIASTAIIVGGEDTDCSEDWNAGYKQGVEDGLQLGEDRYENLLHILQDVLEETVE